MPKKNKKRAGTGKSSKRATSPAPPPAEKTVSFHKSAKPPAPAPPRPKSKKILVCPPCMSHLHNTHHGIIRESLNNLASRIATQTGKHPPLWTSAKDKPTPLALQFAFVIQKHNAIITLGRTPFLDFLCSLDIFSSHQRTLRLESNRLEAEIKPFQQEDNVARCMSYLYRIVHQMAHFVKDHEEGRIRLRGSAELEMKTKALEKVLESEGLGKEKKVLREVLRVTGDAEWMHGKCGRWEDEKGGEGAWWGYGSSPSGKPEMRKREGKTECGVHVVEEECETTSLLGVYSSKV